MVAPLSRSDERPRGSAAASGAGSWKQRRQVNRHGDRRFPGNADDVDSRCDSSSTNRDVSRATAASMVIAPVTHRQSDVRLTMRATALLTTQQNCCILRRGR
jgi:hypothetical protein